jgi:hypothetical protein
MKMVQIFSDLHVDAVYCPVPALAPGVDCVVVGGDTCQSVVAAFETLRQAIPIPLSPSISNTEAPGHIAITHHHQSRSKHP